MEAVTQAPPVAQPAVSVLMTAYNRADYIAESIESVLAQTFTDFELVVIDDASTDATVAVVDRYLRDRRVRLVRNERNLGDYPNRNHAAGLARGEFLKYHDSDDVMYPHCLEIMVHSLRRYPAASFALTSEHGWPGGPAPMFLTPRMAYQREFLGTVQLFNLGPSAAMFRTARFHELGRFPEAGTQSDTLFWLTACARSAIVLAQANLFYYRIHPGQEIGFMTPQALVDVEGLIFRALDSSDCPLTADEIEQARRNLTWGFLKRAWQDVRRGDPGFAVYRLKQSPLSFMQWLRYSRRPHRGAAAGSPSRDARQHV